MILKESEVAMVQIDGPGRQVYINFLDPIKMYDILRITNGRENLNTRMCEISKVRIEEAGLGMMRIRMANIPAEISDRTIKLGLNRYGEVKEVKEENWSGAYRYPVANGIRIATIQLSQHIPSHILIAGYRILFSYEGQSSTCYGCNKIGHVYQECPRRRNTRMNTNANNTTSWAKVAERESRTTAEGGDMDEGAERDASMSAEGTQCVLKDCDTQRLEQDSTIVENTKKAEEQKVVEPTKKIKQKREH
jgi:hypothetical protein